MAIIDGDTIRVRLQGASVERVRLLGIDAPEVQPGEKLDRDAAREGRSKQVIQALGRQAPASAGPTSPGPRRSPSISSATRPPEW